MLGKRPQRRPAQLDAVGVKECERRSPADWFEVVECLVDTFVAVALVDANVPARILLLEIGSELAGVVWVEFEVAKVAERRVLGVQRNPG